MDEQLRNMWKEMVELGLASLGHANRLAAYSSYWNDHTPSLSVLQAAHAAEILIKARIAQEHPLLIFEKMPKYRNGSSLLDYKELFLNGKTVQWSDLLERLWATRR